MTSTEQVDDIDARLAEARNVLMAAETEVTVAVARRDAARVRYDAILREKRGQQ